MPFKFTGHERDDNGSDGPGMLDYMLARYHSPELGRFLSVDPVLGTAEAPQSWNRYTYTRNNPVRFIDPTGKERIQYSLDSEIDVYLEPERSHSSMTRQFRT